MMNLPQFLKAIDEATAAMTKENLADFLHDLARTLPEKQREDFLGRLKGQDRGHSGAKVRQRTQEEDFAGKQKSLKMQLQRIESGELCLNGWLNQEYDEWYDSDDEEFQFSDPEGVLTIVEEACGFVHQCIDYEKYEAACEIADILMDLDIMVDGEYQEYMDTPINIKELKYYHLGNVDYRSLVVDGAHGAYCACELPERAQTLYRIICGSGRKDITLEMIMQSGSELPDIDAFLQQWIEYLGRINTDCAEKLLQEALELTGGGEQLLESARKYCGEHPELYEQYLKSSQGNEDAVSLLAVGMEALEAISKKYIVRSRIALLAGRIAQELGRQQEAEICWLEAFRSDTRVVNYMRLLMECRDFSQFREAAREIYRKSYPKSEKGGYFCSGAMDGKENRTTPANAYMLAFLGGEFSLVREKAMNTKTALGWSASFMKCGLAAFLLLLAEDVPAVAGQWDVLPLNAMLSGSREMLRMIVAAVGFNKTEYEQGMLRVIDESDEDWFQRCWLHWRKMVSLSEEEKNKLLQWTEGLVAKRVEGIIEGNHRNYYGECAAYIAALGEAKEAMGQGNGKQKTMMKYKESYPRRRAFHEELRRYGMFDSRKKK